MTEQEQKDQTKQYYADQIARIANPRFGYPAQIKIRKDPNQTNWLSLNDDSASAIVKFLSENFNIQP